MFVFPINRVPDETNHARMTWETFHKPTETSFKWMDEIPSNDKVKLAEYKQIFAQKIDMSKEPFQFGVSLKTISFIPQLIGMTIGSCISPTVGMIIYMGRIFNALAYILGIYFLIRYFKYGKTALMFISLLPIMVQQASSLSYDVMNYLEVMLALGFITNLAYSKRFTNRNFIQVIGLAILLLATKPNNILLLGLIPFVPLEFEGFLAFLNRPVQAIKTFISKYKAVFYLLFVVGLVVVLQFLMKNQGGLRHYGEVLRNTLFNPELNDNLNGILSLGMFGYLGNLTLQMPLWFFTKDFANASWILFLLEVLAAVTVMYMQWTPVVLGQGANISVGAQGRYFTPFIILLLPLVANIAKVDLSRQKRLKIATLTLIANFLVAMYLILFHYWGVFA